MKTLLCWNVSLCLAFALDAIDALGNFYKENYVLS